MKFKVSKMKFFFLKIQFFQKICHFLIQSQISQKKTFLKSIHWVYISAWSSFFEKHIILAKPFQPARADISCSFFEKHIIVQNFLLSEWALIKKSDCLSTSKKKRL